MSQRGLWITGALLALLLWLPPLAWAQDEEGGLSLQVDAGFDGTYKANQWLPVFVTVANDGPAIEGRLQLVTGNGQEEVVYEAPVSLPTRSRKRVPLYTFVTGYPRTLTVSLRDARGNLLRAVESQRLVRLDEDALLYGVVSDESGGFTFLEDVHGNRGDAGVAFLGVDDLPSLAAAWNGLDILVFSNVDSGRLGPQQSDALRQWVETGGQLVVTGGLNWQPTTAAFTDLLPLGVSGSESLASLSALETSSGVPFSSPGPYTVAAGTLQQGTVLLRQEAVPLLARRSLGRGAVYFLALDPTQPPLLGWAGNETLWSDVAAGTPTAPPWTDGPRNAYEATAALNALPALALPSALWLAAFLGAYVLVVGPGNYLLLRRVGRRELAWVTIPVAILLFTLVAYAAGSTLRGGQVVFHEMSIASGHADGEAVRVHTLLGIYSPQRHRYDVTLPGDTLARPFSRTYGDVLQGGGTEEAIRYDGNTVLSGVQIDVSGVATYATSTYRPAPPINGRGTLRLSDGDAYLDVNVQNNGDVTFEHAGILLGTAFIPIGDLDGGASASKSHRLGRSQAAAVAGSGSVPSLPVSGSGLAAHYEALLGTASYGFSNDSEVTARYHLLESLQSLGGPGAMSAQRVPRGAITLVGWLPAESLPATLDRRGRDTDTRGSTLYFLELPLERVVPSGSGVEVPPQLLEWDLLDTFGVFAPGFSDVTLTPGWMELAYRPGAAFAGLTVTDLTLVLHAAGTPGDAPDLFLWDWQAETWRAVGEPVWGEIGVSDFEPFLGPENEVRLHVENRGTDPLRIEEIYPSLTGRIE